MNIFCKTTFAAIAALALTACANNNNYVLADDPAPAAEKPAFDESVLDIKEGQNAQYYKDAETKLREEISKLIQSKPSGDVLNKAFTNGNRALARIFKYTITAEGADDAARNRGREGFCEIMAAMGDFEELQSTLEAENAKSEKDEAFIKMLESKLMAAKIASAGSKGDADELKKIADEVVANSLKDPDSSWPTLIANILDSNTSLALPLVKDAIEKFNASGNDRLKNIANGISADVRFAELVGNEMLLEGLFLDGSEIDKKNYENKVVLVDFWATWCGPCRAEIPNVKALYEKYRDAGFEVIGYSIDRDLAALEKFQEEQKLPYPIASSAKTSQSDKNYTILHNYYGINAIPTMILIGRDGKVIDTNARGEHLKELLEKQFPEVK